MGRDLKKIYDLRLKENLVRDLIFDMERRCATFFTWGFPETIEQRWAEMLLQRNTNFTFAFVKNEDIKQYTDSREIPEGWYVLDGGIGGVEDFNGLGVFSIVAHPRLLKSLQLKIDEDCVVCYNDSMHRGLYDIHLRYASQIAEALLTLHIANVSTRAMTIATVGTDTEKIAFENYMRKLELGEQSALIGNLVMDSIKMQDYAGSAHQMLTDVIEEIQYLKASWLRELGMDENFNMKREAIMGDEATMGEDSIMTLLEDMLNERRKFCKKVKEVFGLDITVDFSRTFKNNLIENKEDEENDNLRGESGIEEENPGAGVGTETVEEGVETTETTEGTTEAGEEPTGEAGGSEGMEESDVEEPVEETEEQQEAEVVINVNIGEAEEVSVVEEEVENGDDVDKSDADMADGSDDDNDEQEEVEEDEAEDEDGD